MALVHFMMRLEASYNACGLIASLGDRTSGKAALSVLGGGMESKFGSLCWPC